MITMTETPMRIGYTIMRGNEQERDRLMTDGRCDRIIEAQEHKMPLESFEACIRSHPNTTIVGVEMESIGIQLINYATILPLMKENQVTLILLEKEMSTDEAFQTLLYRLALKEKKMMTQRTQLGLKKAKLSGHLAGRPPLEEATISKIRQLFLQNKLPLRELADICQVSLGTVHKYTRNIGQES